MFPLLSAASPSGDFGHRGAARFDILPKMLMGLVVQPADMLQWNMCMSGVCPSVDFPCEHIQYHFRFQIFCDGILIALVYIPGWWFQTFSIFTPETWGRVPPILTCAYFFRWVGEKPPTRIPISCTSQMNPNEWSGVIRTIPSTSSARSPPTWWWKVRAFLRPKNCPLLGGGFWNIFYFYPYLVKWSIFTNIFLMGWNHQLALVQV